MFSIIISSVVIMSIFIDSGYAFDTRRPRNTCTPNITGSVSANPRHVGIPNRPDRARLSGYSRIRGGRCSRTPRWIGVTAILYENSRRIDSIRRISYNSRTIRVSNPSVDIGDRCLGTGSFGQKYTISTTGYHDAYLGSGISSKIAFNSRGRPRVMYCK